MLLAQLSYNRTKEEGSSFMPEQSKQTSKKYYDPISMASRTRQLVYSVGEHDKMRMLAGILKESGECKTVVIAKSKKRADALGKYLNTEELNAKVIHGNHRKSDYEEAAEAFNSDEVKILITTDRVLQALGLENVECIVNFDIPMEVDNYAKSLSFVDEKGVSLSLLSPEDEGLFSVIEMLLKVEIADGELKGFTPSEPDDTSKQRTKEKKKKPRHRSFSGKKAVKKEPDVK